MSRRVDLKNAQNLNATEKTRAVPGNKKIKSTEKPSSTRKTPTQNKKPPVQVEVICLSDSEDAVVRAPPKSKVEKKQVNNSNLVNATSEVKETALPTTPPPRDLEEYYRSRGLSLSHIRRLNRTYVRHDGLSCDAGGLVFWDSFTPPPGFTEDDIPKNDSQGTMPPPEQVISPAILNAEKYKMRPRAILKVSDSDEEFQELLQRLTKRKAEKENSPQPSKRSTPEGYRVSPNQPNLSESLNTSVSFPTGSDDLNDSLLMQCTQAAEQQFINNNSDEENINAMEVRDTGNNMSGPISTSTPMMMPNGQRSLHNTDGVLETPTSAKTNSNRTTGSRLSRLSRKNNTSATTEASLSSSNLSLFENSGPARSTRRTPKRGIVSDIPRINLFEKSEIPPPPEPVVVVEGDFIDDDNDDIFSQIEIPEMIENKVKPVSISEQSTLLINQSDDSFLRQADFLSEIDRLEEIALDSGKAKINGAPSVVVNDKNKKNGAVSSITGNNPKNNARPTPTSSKRGNAAGRWK